MPTLQRSHRLLLVFFFLWRRIQDGTALISSSFSSAGHLQKPRLVLAATTNHRNHNWQVTTQKRRKPQPSSHDIHRDSHHDPRTSAGSTANQSGANNNKMIATTTCRTLASMASSSLFLAALATMAVTILGHPQMAVATTKDVLGGAGATIPHQFSDCCGWEETSVFLCQSFEVSVASSIVNLLMAIAYAIYLENKSRKERKLEYQKMDLKSDIHKLRLNVDRLNKMELEPETWLNHQLLKVELESDMDKVRSNMDRLQKMGLEPYVYHQLKAELEELDLDRLKMEVIKSDNYDKLQLERLESDILDKVRSDMDRLKTDLESDLHRPKMELIKPDNHDKLKLEILELDMHKVRSDIDKLKFSATLDRIGPTDNEKLREELRADIIDVRSYVIRVEGNMLKLQIDVDTMNEKIDGLSKDILRQLLTETTETKKRQLVKPDNHDKLKLELLESDMDKVRSNIDKLKVNATLDRIGPTDNKKLKAELEADIIDVRLHVIEVAGDVIKLKSDVKTINEKIDGLSKDIRQLTTETKRQELD